MGRKEKERNKKKKERRRKWAARATASAAAKGELGGMWIAKCFGTDRNKHKTHTHTHTRPQIAKGAHMQQKLASFIVIEKSQKKSPDRRPDPTRRRDVVQFKPIK
jgi:hypothetical protein